jgi:NADH-quinone oxidoreductase subunit L
MFRLYFSIFWNRPYVNHASDHHSDNHHGEGGWVMMLPLVLLAIGSAVAGFIPFGNFVSSDNRLLALPFHLSFSIAPVLIGIAGITIALIMYKTSNELPTKWSTKLNGIYQLAYHKLYIDELYLFLTKKVIFNIIGNTSAWIDQHIVNGMINTTGAITQNIAEAIKKLQSGKVQQYGIYFFTSVIIIVVVFIYVWN